uniref:Uncharacterized protein n=1 Tax=Octopus bimaculoides TaxID=37653 RepID=A0A0L8H776_OCTBM
MSTRDKGYYDILHEKKKTYGIVEVRFVSEEEARKHYTVPLRSAEWALLPTYCSKRAARVRLDRIPPEIDEAWLVAAILYNTEEDAQVLKISRMTEKERGEMWNFHLKARRRKERQRRTTRTRKEGMRSQVRNEHKDCCLQLVRRRKDGRRRDMKVKRKEKQRREYKQQRQRVVRYSRESLRRGNRKELYVTKKCRDRKDNFKNETCNKG